jgi:beta-mannosidase
MKNIIHQSLDGDWKIAVIHDADLAQCTIPADSKSLAVLASHCVGAKVLDGKVPGNFELELINSAQVQDPFFGKNILDMYQYEDCHVFYGRTFDYSVAGASPELVFSGIDTLGDIYLNGDKIAATDNMYITHRIPVPGIKQGENDLLVHLKPVCLEARKNKVSAGNSHQRYNYECLRLRKAPHMFGWDIMPRLVSAGIFRTVGIYNRPPESFKQLYIMTSAVDLNRGSANLELFFDAELGNRPIHSYSIQITGKCSDSTFSHEEKIWFSSGKIEFTINDALFWWPKGYGEANLYEVTVKILKGGKAVESYSTRLGIRTCTLVRTGTTDMFFKGDFHFEINGKKIFILGTNWVPLDPFHSRDLGRIPETLKLLDDLGCNMVRCWGGNVYEDPLFFNSCDELGILVWQDFAMACGIYPIDSEFMKVLRDETVEVVRSLRQHPCIVLWAGDNECDQFIHDDPYGRNPNFNRLTREVLPDVVAIEDPARSYIPSSPYFDGEGAKLPQAYLTENHLWGPRDYYKSDFFKNSLSHFASEIGYHGCTAKVSMKQFLSPDKLWPWYNNDEWNLHSSSPEADHNAPYVYRIELMAKQIRELFGHIPGNQDDFILASQISQAEAKKFFVELFRASQWKRSGLTWWNLIDGWPQFSDAVVDYFYVKKLAYFYLWQSQKPFIITFAEPREWNLGLTAVNNSREQVGFRYTVRDYDTGKTVLSGEGRCGEAESCKIDSLPYSQGEKKLYLIQWDAAQLSGKNHYLAGNPPFDLSWYKGFLQDVYAAWLKEAQIEMRNE